MDDAEESVLSYQRYRTLHGSTRGAMSAGRLRESLDEIRFDATTAESYPVRTLWRTVFDLRERSMSTHFFLWRGRTGLRYSEEPVFTAVH